MTGAVGRLARRGSRRTFMDSPAVSLIVPQHFNHEHDDRMKSSYELAMERLNKQGPTAKLTAAQKADLADLDARYAAKIAEREIFLKGELAKAVEKGDGEEYQQIEKQLLSERKKFQAELEEKKEAVRNAGR